MAKSAAAHDTTAFQYLELLGVQAQHLREVLRLIARGLPFGAIEKLQHSAGFELEDITALVQIPRRTLTRRRNEGRFAPEESDRLVAAARLLSKALDLFEGNAEAAREWLQAPQVALAGAIPLDIARTETGAREVEILIDRLEQGIFS
jgi:putative toxin-antitoxin system antitoxin component (TIGR02293 family)